MPVYHAINFNVGTGLRDLENTQVPREIEFKFKFKSFQMKIT